jgi:hypothetical protein
MKTFTLTLAMLLSLTAARAANADETRQIPVDSLLNGRPVSTLSAGAVVPWTVGVDQNDGFVTTAVAQFLKQTGPALPDDGSFAADDQHPQVVLHFSNAASATSPQAYTLSGLGKFEVPVPSGTYSKLYLILTSSYGDSALTVDLIYSDSTSAPVSFTLPDWGTGQPLPADPPIFFNLISGLHKWDQQNASVDTPTHTITGVVLSPAADQELATVRVTKTNAPPFLLFWGVTGLATTTADGGSSNGGAGSAGSAGASGAAGSSGTTSASASGASGASGGNPSGAGAGALAAAGTAAAAAGVGGAAQRQPANDPSSGCAFASPSAPTAPWPLALAFLPACLLRWASARRAQGRNRHT